MSDGPPQLPGLTLERRIGAGAMGEVWRGRDAGGRPVAVKLLRASAEADRFVREVETLAAVRHPHVVELLGAGRQGELRWVVMELVDGGVLADLLAIGALGPDGLATVLAGVARGLAALHARGIVHRDVKPGNVLLDAQLAPRLVDFGLASFVDAIGRLTGSQEAVGTPRYMAPEVLSGARPGPPADVWAVGVVLLEGLLGRHPLEGQELPALLRRIRAGDLPRPPAGTPPALVAALDAALSLDPTARPDAAGLAALLDQARPSPPPAPRPALAPGGLPREPVGPYELERPLGRGGMASVFLARHEQLGVRRALKLLHARTPRALERFVREGRTLARLPAHPGVVPVHESGTLPEGRAWLAMDLVEGRTLRELLERGPLPLERALRLGARLAEALAHVHAHGVVHRDVKPENVLLRAGDEQPVLVDFGVALDTAEERITHSAAMVGTLAYLAPEQAAPRGRQVGPPTDVHALGLVLQEALTGAPAFPVSSPVEALMAPALRPPSPLRQALPAAPPALEALLVAMLAKSPSQRPSAAEVARALDRIAAGGTWRPRRRLGPLLAGAAGLLLVALAAWGLRPADGPAAPAPAAAPTGERPPPAQLEPALAAAARGERAQATALLAQARAEDEAACRAGVAAVVSAALAAPDREAAARLVDTLDAAWPGGVPAAAATALAERAERREAAGDLDGALADWSRAMDVDPWRCPDPEQLGLAVARRAADLARAHQVEAAARLILIGLRAGWPRQFALGTVFQAVARLPQPPPGCCERAPWVWDLACAIGASEELRELDPDEERRRLACEPAVQRLDRVLAAPDAPPGARLNARRTLLVLLDMHSLPADVEARARAFLAAPPGPGQMPGWEVEVQIARAWIRAGEPLRGEPWIVRALERLERLPTREPPALIATYQLGTELAVTAPDPALAERLLGGDGRSLVPDCLPLLQAVLAEAAGDLARARELAEEAQRQDPRDVVTARLLARLRRQ